jgi:hypothetical protein
LPGQNQARATPLHVQPSGAATPWQFQATSVGESHLVVPGMSGTSAVRYTRLSNSSLQRAASPQSRVPHQPVDSGRRNNASMPRSLSPQPSSHQHGNSASVQPSVSKVALPVAITTATAFATGLTPGPSQRSLTPVSTNRGEANCYSPQPRTAYAYIGMGDVAPQPFMPLAAAIGSGNACMEADAANCIPHAANSFILTSGNAMKTADRTASPQPSRPMSPMPGVAPSGFLPCRPATLLYG